MNRPSAAREESGPRALPGPAWLRAAMAALLALMLGAMSAVPARAQGVEVQTLAATRSAEGVSVKTWPLSWSCSSQCSKAGSCTGSLDHGVIWCRRLLPAQLRPLPVSETWKPKSGLAMTLTHGRGVTWPPCNSNRNSPVSASNSPPGDAMAAAFAAPG